jgi:hypothetical protein
MEIRGESRYTTHCRNPSGKWASTDWQDKAVGNTRVRNRKAGPSGPGTRGKADFVSRYS